MNEIINQHEGLIKTGGLFEQRKSILKISGPDAADFLHRLTTQDVKHWAPGAGSPTAILQPNAMLVSIFNLYHCGNFFLVVTDHEHGMATTGFFEKFHFAENLEISDVSEAFTFLTVQGAKARDAVIKIFAKAPERLHEVLGTEDSFIFREEDFREPGYHLLIKSDRVSTVTEAFKKLGFLRLHQELWNVLRIESGHFTLGVDLTEKNLILEGPLATAVSRNKGCYPGQEVVERVFTYGNVSKKLVGLRWSSPLHEPVDLRGGLKVKAADKEVGLMTSAARVPWSGMILGFAMVRKPHYKEGEILHVEGVTEPATVFLLPDTFEIKRQLAESPADS